MSFSSGIQRHPPQTSLRSLRLGPAPEKKTNSEKILVFGDHHPKASGIQHSVYIYIYVRIFIYLFIGLFIYWFIYIFIYLLIYLFYVYIYTHLIYINWHQPLVINWLYAHHALIFWCFNHQLFIVEPLILIARFSFSGYIWPNRWICLVNIPIWSVFKTFCHSIILVG